MDPGPGMSEGLSPPEAVTVTVVFTDLVGSTALFSRLGPRRAERLQREHLQQLRTSVSQHGAILATGLGDGIMAVFRGVAAGLEAAIAIQQSVDRHNRTGGEHLAVRVGIATGEAVADEDSYHGEAVVEAARVCSIAEGGQILATEAVRLLGRRTSHRFVVLGERALKGLPDPVLVLEVAWEPIRERPLIPFPPRLAELHAAPFVGRQPERSLLERRLSETWAGARHAIVVSGEPGVGKTRLSAHLAASASDMGAAALYGRCDEELGRPYEPWIEALGYLVANCDPSLVSDCLEQDADDLARLLPDVIGVDRFASERTSSDPETDRYRLWGAVARLITSVSSEAPVVLVLDDLQWADRESIQLLRHLLGMQGEMRLLILATYRDTEVRADHPLGDLLVWLHREPRVELVKLTGLREADIVDLMEQLAGHTLEAEGIALATALWRETDGNPFFTRELLRHLSETAAISRRTDGRWVTQSTLDIRSLPTSVREVIAQRVRRLGPEAEEILGVAAVVGRDFDIDVVAAAADVHQDHVLVLLERACAAALTTETSDVPGRFSFNHALTQHTLDGRLSATRRQRLHCRIAETLEVTHGDEPGERLSELAWHWAAAGLPDPGKAIHYATLAGDSALSSLGPDEALRWYSRALGLLESRSAPDEVLRCQLLVSLGVAQRQAGDPVYRETLLGAGRMARDLGEVQLVVRAALAVHRGFYASGTHIDHERVALIETALDMIDREDTPERARLLATLASELTFDPDHVRRKALAAEAVSVARRTHDRAALLDALCIPRLAVHLPDTVDQRLTETAEAVELARSLGDPAARFWAYHTRRYPLLMAGDIDESDRCLEEVEDFVAQVGQPALLWSLSVYRAASALHGGDATEAERLSSVAAKLGEESGQPDTSSVHGVQMLLIRWHQGRLGELVPLLEQIRAENPGAQIFAGTLAMAYVEADNPDAAQGLLDEAGDMRWELPLDYIWSMAMAYWSHSAAEVGDVDASAALYEQLLPWHARVGFTANGVTGAVAHYLGRLACVLGRTDEAEEHFREALAVHERLRGPFFIAQTKLAWGQMLRSTDRERACALLTEAGDLADRYGCERVGRLAHQALAGAGQIDP